MFESEDVRPSTRRSANDSFTRYPPLTLQGAWQYDDQRKFALLHLAFVTFAAQRVLRHDHGDAGVHAPSSSREKVPIDACQDENGPRLGWTVVRGGADQAEVAHAHHSTPPCQESMSAHGGHARELDQWESYCFPAATLQLRLPFGEHSAYSNGCCNPASVGSTSDAVIHAMSDINDFVVKLLEDDLRKGTRCESTSGSCDRTVLRGSDGSLSCCTIPYTIRMK